ncbi:MAG TPA: glycerophosphodiester phosphodiesterase [bacterium]|nr:glycerophosphodiester phosphodiesterase [bacterium]
MASALNEKIVIAHRGASGYLPEHTLASKALAYGMGAHFLEQDVVLTRDDHPIILHDIYLDTMTSVAIEFPGRERGDGRYYAIDFTLEEIKTLHVSERIDPLAKLVVHPNRFPWGKSRFEIVTLREEIELIQGLNASMHRHTGIYPELKAPKFHTAEGKDLLQIALSILQEYGYTGRESRCFLQCFDSDALRELRSKHKVRLPLVQLLGDECREWDAFESGQLSVERWLNEIAAYAEGIAPDMEMVYGRRDQMKRPAYSSLVEQAHALGLFVHPYNCQADVLPEYANTMEDVLEIFYSELDVEGLFTDFPDRAVRFLEHHAAG